jgi:hypothetical protein
MSTQKTTEHDIVKDKSRPTGHALHPLPITGTDEGLFYELQEHLNKHGELPLLQSVALLFDRQADIGWSDEEQQLGAFLSVRFQTLIQEVQPLCDAVERFYQRETDK